MTEENLENNSENTSEENKSPDVVDNNNEQTNEVNKTISDEAQESEEKTEEKELEKKEEKELVNKEEVKSEENVDLSKVDSIEAASDVLKPKGFDMASLQDEFNIHGELTEATISELNKVGISTELIDNFIEGQKARVEKEIEIISEALGGRDVFNNLCEWIRDNATDEEKIAITEIKNVQVLASYLKDFKKKMEDKEGVLPQYVRGMASNATSNVYKSKAEMQEDIRNPKYKIDEAFRERVRVKIEASLAAGTLQF